MAEEPTSPIEPKSPDETEENPYGLSNVELMILRHAHSSPENQRTCPPWAIFQALKCVICNTMRGPQIYGSCNGQERHIICKPCFNVCNKTLDNAPVLCPFEFSESSTYCGHQFSPLFDEDEIPPYWKHFLDKNKYSCSAKIYGCDFIGTGTEIRKHEETDCKLRQCTTEMVSGVGSPSSNVERDVNADAAQSFVPSFHISFPAGFIAFVEIPLNEKVPDNQKDWFPLFRTVVSDNKDARRYLFHGDHNTSSIRVWISNMNNDTNDREEIPIMVTVPGSGSKELTQSKIIYVGKVLPKNTHEFREDDITIPYFEIPKTFARQWLKESPNGFTLQVLLCFGNPMETPPAEEPTTVEEPAAIAEKPASETPPDPGEIEEIKSSSSSSSEEEEEEESEAVAEEEEEEEPDSDEIPFRPFFVPRIKKTEKKSESGFPVVGASGTTRGPDENEGNGSGGNNLFVRARTTGQLTAKKFCQPSMISWGPNNGSGVNSALINPPKPPNVDDNDDW